MDISVQIKYAIKHLDSHIENKETKGINSSLEHPVRLKITKLNPTEYFGYVYTTLFQCTQQIGDKVRRTV